MPAPINELNFSSVHPECGFGRSALRVCSAGFCAAARRNGGACNSLAGRKPEHRQPDGQHVSPSAYMRLVKVY